MTNPIQPLLLKGPRSKNSKELKKIPINQCQNKSVWRRNMNEIKSANDLEGSNQLHLHLPILHTISVTENFSEHFPSKCCATFWK